MTGGGGGAGCVFGDPWVFHASAFEVTLSCFLCVFLTGEFQPKPSVLGDSGISGQEREQLAGRADARHSGLMNYIKARFCSSTHFPLLGTLEFRSTDFRFQPNMSVQPTVHSQSLQHLLSKLEAFFFFFLFAPDIESWLQPCSSLDCLIINEFCFLIQVQPLLKPPNLTN